MADPTRSKLEGEYTNVTFQSGLLLLIINLT